ncbi:MAG: hypothetical protein IH950_03665 [Bacteroidetes bacterium]|nr:hypothetical protein [Bacteroidota bacterium]
MTKLSLCLDGKSLIKNLNRAVMGKQKTKTPTITFRYKHLNNYRTYHVDGVFGGFNAKGNLILELFTEKNPLPKFIVQEMTKKGEIGKEIERDRGETGVIRQIECGLSMDISTATSLRNWLDGKIEEYENILSGKKK